MCQFIQVRVDLLFKGPVADTSMNLVFRLSTPAAFVILSCFIAVLTLPYPTSLVMLLVRYSNIHRFFLATKSCKNQ